MFSSSFSVLRLCIVVGIVVALLVVDARAGNILFTYIPEGKSHLRSLLPLIKSFAEAGHNVTVLYINSKDPYESDPGIFGLSAKLANNTTGLPRPFHVPFVPNESGFAQMAQQIWLRSMYAWTMPFVYFVITPPTLEVIDKEIEHFRKVIESPWDLVMTSALFCPHGAAIALLLHRERGVPYISTSTAMLFPSDAYNLGMAHSPVIHAFPFSAEPRDSNDYFKPSYFSDRFLNVLNAFTAVFTTPISEIILAPAVASLNIGMLREKFSYYQLMRGSSAVFVDQIDQLAHPLPTASFLLNYGPNCEKAKPLAEEFRRFVENPASKGTVYVAFGTAVRWDGAPLEKQHAFFDALDLIAGDNYRVILSLKTQMPEGRRLLHPDRIMIVQWAPQLEILAHPRTKVFLSHAGLKSLKESICSATPILTMPVFAEQSHNARMALKLGIGRVINKYTFTADQIYADLKELLGNDQYRRTVERVKKLYLDLPMSPTDAAEFAASRAIRTRKRSGLAERRNALEQHRGAELTSFQHFFLDQFLVAFALAFFFHRK